MPCAHKGVRLTRMNKIHKRESIIQFANDSLKIIKENLNLDDRTKREDPTSVDWIFRDGWYYYLRKSVANIETIGIEICVRRQNFRVTKDGDEFDKFYEDQPIGNRIQEDAFVYEEGKITDYSKGTDTGYKNEGFSVWNYEKTAF